MKIFVLDLSFTPLALFALANVSTGGVPDNGVDLVSSGLAGAAGDGDSKDAAISANGRYVAFSSLATNLVPNDTNNLRDIFWHDRQTGVTERVSESSGGTQANGSSNSPTISANGRYVAFASSASDLVPNDGNSSSDIFLHDRITGFTTRVSVTSAGDEADDDSYEPAISGNGEVIAFESDATNLWFVGNGGARQVYAHDTTTGGTYLCSRAAFTPGNFQSRAPDVSYDGSRIVFRSDATNLQVGDNLGVSDIFLFDAGTLSVVTRGWNGALPDRNSLSPAISADGGSVTYESNATNLIEGGTLGNHAQIFLYDIAADSTVLVSRATSGDHGGGSSHKPSISHDGRRVVFRSFAGNLVPGDTNGLPDAFVRDLTTETTVCLSRLPDGQQGRAENPVIAAGGDHLAFDSEYSGYVPGHTGTIFDVFVRDYGALSRNAGTNPESYAASRPVIGEEWRGSVDLTATGHSFAVLHGKASAIDVALGGGQHLLISGPSVFKLPAQPGPAATWAGIIPADPGLAGLPLHTQAVLFGGVTPFALSNAQDLCLGY